jgi:hypothetical protein
MKSCLKYLVYFFALTLSTTYGQLPLNEEQLLARINPGSTLPEKLLSSKSAVFYPVSVTTKELEMMQTSFQKSGIDAVVYFENDLLTAGRDVAAALARALISREINNLILVQKNGNGITLLIGEFNRKANFFEAGQPLWSSQNTSLEELLRTLYKTTASGSIKKENFLINDFPEIGLSVNPFQGKRNEFYAVDLKVDPLAVPRFGNEEMDKQLEEIMKTYPFKYTLTDPNLSEADLRKQGLLFVLRFVHARAKIAKGVMAYDMTKSESAVVSITFPENEPQLKNIPANTEVYKFYFKHIDSDNVFLGTKWDADTSWQQALINQIKGLKIELRIN